jgi:Carboxypeptidase regulatory-like domain
MRQVGLWSKLLLIVVALIPILSPPVAAQRVTGSITGTVSDPSDAAVPNAMVSVVDEATGKKYQTTSKSDGAFEVIELLPGNYTVTVEETGFSKARFEHVLVQLNTVTPIMVKLAVGQVSEEVKVSAVDLTQVDTVSTDVGGIITQQQTENLPISGRNVMNLAQLEPGVQLRDGSDIDPTKNNSTVVSVQGRSGRETRYQWDGLSVQDPMFGGTAVNIGLDSIAEFQVAEATHNPSQSVASAGAINMVSNRGGNDLHGSGFGYFRDHRFAADIAPIATPYDFYQIGGHLGGSLVKDKLFFFTDIERTDDRDSFYANPPIFTTLQGSFPKPFTDNFGVLRLDWTPNSKFSVFARTSYEWNKGVSGTPALGGPYLNGFDNDTRNNIQAIGATLVGSRWTQEFKFGRVSFDLDMTGANGLPTPRDSMGRAYNITVDGGATLDLGPAYLAPEIEKAHDDEFRYDAGWIGGHHTLRIGGDLTHEEFYTTFPLYSLGPQLNTASTATGVADPTSPFDYPLQSFILGNGLGVSTNQSIFNYKDGGWFNWQPAVYFHDTWALPHHVTVNYGLRYMYQTGIFDTWLKRDPTINQFIPGYGDKTTSPTLNFAPEAGVAWDPTGRGKTVIRAAVGRYFEDISLEEYYIDPSSFIPTNIGLSTPFVGPGLPLIDPRSGSPFAAGDPLATSFGFPLGTGEAQLAPLFGQPISAVATQVNNLAGLLQAASVSASNGSAPTLFQTVHAISNSLYGTTAWTPNPKTPYTWQINAEIEREIRPGWLLSVGYIRVRASDFGLIVDQNHVGKAAVADFDPTLATAAIAAANASVGCPANASSAAIGCAIGSGATIATYGSFGLGEGPASQGFAFRGQNPNFGTMDYFIPKGESDYNGMNVQIQGRTGPVDKEGLTWIKSNQVTLTYTLSRLTGNVRAAIIGRPAEIGAFAYAWNNDDLTGSQYQGPMGLDRTDMFNLGTITELKGGFQFGLISHLWSAYPQNTLLPTGLGLGVPAGTKGPDGCVDGPEEIFCTDVDGDGSVNDLLPTAGGPGQFGRGLKGAGGLNKAISAYNNKYAGNLTPAGNLLVSQGFFTSSQLQQLGAVMPVIPLAPSGQASLDPLLQVDSRIAYHHQFWDRVTLEPSLDVFNLFNHAQFDPPNDILDGNLRGTIGTINGTLPGQRVNRRTRGSGTFDEGGPRTLQAGLRLTF